MRTINAAKNPRWGDPTGFRIDMDVDFDELDEVYVPFTAYQNDSEPHSVELFNRASSGEFGPIADYVPPSDITGDEAIALMRQERNTLLADTDYIENQTYWSGLTAEQQGAWTDYRNALRDITDTVPNPVYSAVVTVDTDDPESYTTTWAANFNWPEKP